MLLLAETGCGGRSRTAVTAQEVDAAALPAELLLDSREMTSPALGADGAIYATEISRRGARAVRLGAGGGKPSELAPGFAGESRLAALLADGRRALIELDGDPAAPLTLVLREVDGRLDRLPPIAAGRERFLSDARQDAFLTAVPDDGDGERIVENGPALAWRRIIYTAPAGFRIAAASADTNRLALVRSLDERADEVVWHDRTNGETRLLLPLDREGRFEPLLFAPDGSSLLVRAELAGEPAILATVDLASSRVSRFGSFRCPPRSARRSGDSETLLVELSCDGRTELLRVDREAREQPSPTLPAGTRLLDWSGRPGAASAVSLAGGATWPPDLLVSAGMELLPLTYGLPPRLPPSALPQPEALDLGRVAGLAFAELWRAPALARAACIWLDASGARERFDPLVAALAAGGAHVLRAAAGPGAFADGSARAFLSAAGARITREIPAGAPMSLVVDGEMSAVVEAAAASPTWSQLVWLWPELPPPPAPEPRPAKERAAKPARPAAIRTGEREAEDPLLALLLRPGKTWPSLLLVLDSADPRTASRIAALAAFAPPAGSIAVLAATRSRLSPRFRESVALALLARTLPRAVSGPDTEQATR